MNIFSVIVVVFCSIAFTSAISLNGIKFREKVEQARRDRADHVIWKHLRKYLLKKFRNGLQADAGLTGPPYPDLYLEQPLDHFDPQHKGTYKQRYWVNKLQWRNPENGPVFLYIGGEGGLTNRVVQAGEHYDLAEKYGALIFGVEHRFYGKSVNEGGLELENLQYLSSQQALADLAHFHTYATEKYNLTNKNTWICFGGSYPGALSAWFRIKYPHLVYGAIASSAPVEAKVNFEGYNDVVASSLSDPVVNGSTQCADNVRLAFKAVDQMIDSERYAELSRDFNSCSIVEDPKDVFQFVSNLADPFMGTVQYNTEVPGQNITTICNIMNKSGDPYNNLKELYNVMAAVENCTDNTWDSMIQMLANTSQVSEGVGIRQWLYQTCTQFGYYQTCDRSTSCLFSQRMTLNMNLEICKELYNIEPEEVYDRVEFSNAYYGSNNPGGTRIVFVNGSIDPWHALSILTSSTTAEVAIYINGTAHCANMNSNEPTDPPALREAREKIDSIIGSWLESTKRNDEKEHKLYFKPYYPQ